MYSTALAPLLCIAVAEGTVHMLVVVIGGAVGHALRGTCELLLHALSMLPTFLLPIYIWNSHPPRISLPLFPVENIVSAAKTPGVFRTPEISCKSPPPSPFSLGLEIQETTKCIILPQGKSLRRRGKNKLSIGVRCAMKDSSSCLTLGRI